mgnify:CR=1 FL=1
MSARYVMIDMYSKGGGMNKKELRKNRLKSLIGERVTIILAEPPEPKSKSIRIQDFTRDGQKYVPFFSSKEVFLESTKGADIGKPVYQIDRRLFADMEFPEHLLMLNPGMVTETVLTREEFKEIFPESFPWDELKRKQA